MLKQTLGDGKVVLNFHNFLPGSVVAVKVKLGPTAQVAVAQLRSFITGKPGCAQQWDDLQRVLESMTLADMNVALYRCNEEEVEDGRPGCYNIPGFGSFVYCGLQGIMSYLSDIRPNNDLGHPICGNLRDGDWLSGNLFFISLIIVIWCSYGCYLIRRVHMRATPEVRWHCCTRKMVASGAEPIACASSLLNPMLL